MSREPWRMRTISSVREGLVEDPDLVEIRNENEPAIFQFRMSMAHQRPPPSAS